MRIRPFLAFALFSAFFGQRATPLYAQSDVRELIREVSAKNGAATVRSVTTIDYQKLRVWSSKNDSTLLVFIEQYDRDSSTDGNYWQRTLLREETATLPVQLARLAYFHPVNLYDTKIELPDYDVTGPLGKFGLNDYLFSLESDSGNTEQIKFEHKGIFFPGLNGTMWIDKTSKRLLKAIFGVNDAVKLGVLHDIEWKEYYKPVGSVNLPERSLLTLVARTEIPMLPQYSVRINNYFSEYTVTGSNGVIAQSEGIGQGLSDAMDSIQFTKLRYEPLSGEENAAYQRASALELGSTHPHLTSGGLLSNLLLDPDIIQYNRVEGVRLQLRERVSEIGSWPLGIDALGAYGFGDKKFKYDVTATQGIFWHDAQIVRTGIGMGGGFKTTVQTVPVPWLSIGGRIHDDRELRGKARSIAMNTLSALLYKSDYPDYFWSHGVTAFIDYKPHPFVEANLAFKSEMQTNIDSIVTSFSILSPHKPFRQNPVINEGNLRELRGTLNYNSLPEGFAEGKQLYSRIELAHADKSWSSDFDYTSASLHVAFDLPVQQWGMTTIYFDASSILSGAFGNQHLFLFETPRGFSNRTRSFLTIRDREFQGDKIAMLYLEQNMYDLPVRVLGLHFLEPLDLQFFALANVGWSGLSDSTAKNLRYPVETTGKTPYAEAGLGVGNIFNFLRIDAAWRLTHPEAFGSGFTVILTLALTL